MRLQSSLKFAGYRARESLLFISIYLRNGFIPSLLTGNPVSLKRQERTGIREHSSFLGTEKVGKLLFKLSAPSVIGMLVYAFYNVVNTIFVGRALGEESVSGIGGLVIAFLSHMLAMGIAIGLGVGGSSIVSRALGSKELHKAEKALGPYFSWEFSWGLPTRLQDFSSLIRCWNSSEQRPE